MSASNFYISSQGALKSCQLYMAFVTHQNQHGFRSNHSCITQLLALTEDLSFALDHQQQMDVILSSSNIMELIIMFMNGFKHGLLNNLSV